MKDTKIQSTIHYSCFSIQIDIFFNQYSTNLKSLLSNYNHQKNTKQNHKALRILLYKIPSHKEHN